MDSLEIKFHGNSQNLLQHIYDNLEEILPEETITFFKTREWWTGRHDVLQKYLERLVPGTHLVACPGDTDEIEKLDVFELRIVDNDMSQKKMKKSACHDNSAKLLLEKKVGELHTGWALSNDRRWRYHSWCVDFEGNIIETTEKRLAYLTAKIFVGKK